MKKIRLGGKLLRHTVVDDADFEYLNQFRWTLDAAGYAVRNSKTRGGKIIRLYMHRVIMQPTGKMVVDHLNGNKLDNQRGNLRNCSQRVNTRNKNVMNSNNTSGATGVIIDKRQPGRPFIARIEVDGKQLYLGGFASLAEAASRYNRAAINYFGLNALLNEVENI